MDRKVDALRNHIYLIMKQTGEEWTQADLAEIQDFIADNDEMMLGFADEFPKSWDVATLRILKKIDLFQCATMVWSFMQFDPESRIRKYDKACYGELQPTGFENSYPTGFERTPARLTHDSELMEANICFDSNFLDWWELIETSTSTMASRIIEKYPDSNYTGAWDGFEHRLRVGLKIQDYAKFNSILPLFRAKYPILFENEVETLETSAEELAEILPIARKKKVESSEWGVPGPGDNSIIEAVQLSASVFHTFNQYGFDFALIEDRYSGETIYHRFLAPWDKIRIAKNQNYL